MAATLAYLKEWGWTTDNLYQWHRHETAFMTEAHINMQICEQKELSKFDPWARLDHGKESSQDPSKATSPTHAD